MMSSQTVHPLTICTAQQALKKNDINVQTNLYVIQFEAVAAHQVDA